MRSGNLKNNKKYLVDQLKLLECKLKSNYNRNQYFKKLYESNNIIREDGKKEIVTVDENIFSGTPVDVIEYLKRCNDFDMSIFNKVNNSVTIETYWDLIDTIRCLLNVLEYNLFWEHLITKNLNSIDNPT